LFGFLKQGSNYSHNNQNILKISFSFFVFQSFGKVGYWTAFHLQEMGAKLVGLVEKDGSIYNPEGKNRSSSAFYKFKSNFS